MMRCYCGPGDPESLAALVAVGYLTEGDADAIARFRDFLAAAGPPRADQLPELMHTDKDQP